MDKIISWDLGENFVEKLADFLIDSHKQSIDFSNVICVFGGKRPALFLRRALAHRLRQPCFPPRIFSMDEFVSYLAVGFEQHETLGRLDAAYMVYQLARRYAPTIVEKFQGFADFLPWADEIVSFLEQVDLELISDEQLRSVEKSATIGYDVPPTINSLLANIILLRKAWHCSLRDQKIFSRGLLYQEAAAQSAKKDLAGVSQIVFCNFFYLHATELAILKNIIIRDKGVCIFQGSQDDWSVLKKVAKELNVSIQPGSSASEIPKFSVIQAFDLHSQVCAVRRIFQKITSPEKTVIVLPRPETVVPLLVGMADILKTCNVSMGFPVKKNQLFAFFYHLKECQVTRRGECYYTPNYLKLLQHPIIKNLKLHQDHQVTRVLIHKLEDVLSGKQSSSIGGAVFLRLADVEQEQMIICSAQETLAHLGIDLAVQDLKDILSELNRKFFTAWESISNFSEFAEQISLLIELIAAKSNLADFPSNLKILQRFQELSESMVKFSFAQEKFSAENIWDIFMHLLEGELVSFHGSPLQGTQVLGLFETRSLNFENVIVMDMNESVLPKLKIHEPLIPREVMINLGLDRLEKEEEIQRYQFMRLIQGCGQAYFVYEHNELKEKSRFLEALLWQEQKKKRTLELQVFPRISFHFRVHPKPGEIRKTGPMVDFLKKQVYSASRVNTYIRCPVQFYFQYVLGLKETEDLLEEPDQAYLGIFLHELLAETFGRFKDRDITLDQKFQEYFFRRMDEKFELEISRRMRSGALLLHRIVRNRLEHFLEAEKRRNISRIICLEEEKLGSVALSGMTIQFRYTIDRMDELPDRRLLILDYKSGANVIAPKRFSGLSQMRLDRKSIQEIIRSFQLPLYHHFTAQEFPGYSVSAELYSLRTLERHSFISSQEEDHAEEILDICFRALAFVFTEIFNQDFPFLPDRDERKCSACPYQGMCR